MSNGINHAKFASMTPQFFGADARMVIMFFILFMFHMRLWTFALFAVVFCFSFILSYRKINFINFLKKIRMIIASGSNKKIRKKY
jgi:hypothetical protein